MSDTISRDDLLNAYLRGKTAGHDEAARGVYDQEDTGEEELTFDAVLAAFTQASPSDVLRLDAHKPADLIRVLLDAGDRRQFVYRSTHNDGWIMQVLTTHGSVIVNQDSKGGIKVHVPSPPIGSGTLSIREQTLKIQQKYREDGDGWSLETGEQFGRWY